MHRIAPPRIIGRSRDVVGVSRQTIPEDLSIDGGLSGEGPVEGLQDHHPGPLSQHKTVSVPVEWTRGMLRIIVPRGKGPGRRKARHSQRSEGRFGATGQHGIGVPSPDDVIGIPDAVDTGCTSCHGAGIRPFEAHADCDLPGGQVDENHRNEEGRYLTRPSLHQLGVVVLDSADSPDSRSDIDPDPFAGAIVDLEGGILHRHLGCRNGVMDEGVHLLDFFLVDPLPRIEPLHLSSEADRKIGGVKAGDGSHSGPSSAGGVPSRLGGISQGRDDPDTRDDNPPVLEGTDPHQTRSLI